MDDKSVTKHKAIITKLKFLSSTASSGPTRKIFHNLVATSTNHLGYRDVLNLTDEKIYY